MGEGIPGFRTSFDVSGKGGGAFKPISETFAVSPANGTMSLAVPIHTSPSRGGYGPDLTLAYDSGSGNGPFGFGWGVSLPSISRKTAHAIPTYLDDEDELVMSGADIVKKLKDDGFAEERTESGVWGKFDVAIYRARVDAKNVRIERWTNQADRTDVHWRTISTENETSIYGDDDDSRIVDTSDGAKRIFSWLLSRSYDMNGNAIEYTYKREDAKGIVGTDGILPPWEANRPKEDSCRQKYIKRIRYGNKTSSRNMVSWQASNWPQDWMFELVFDYGEHSQISPGTTESRIWPVRQDVFSQSHAGFEVRTYRLCRRLLMFHHFSNQTKQAENLVYSSNIDYDESPQRTVLRTLLMSGHSRDKDGPGGAARYRSESIPPWSFEYSSVPEPSQLSALEANVVNLLELPTSESKVSEWLDLEGEGMPGLLTTIHDGTLYYQRNKGVASSDVEPQFHDPRLLPQIPGIAGGTFEDVDKNGHINYVLRDNAGGLQGYFERRDSDTWTSFSTFAETFSGDGWRDTQTIDLTGDGLADTLSVVDDSQTLAWQQNLGKKGVAGFKRIHETNPQRRPNLTQTPDFQTYVADMTGSGLSDLVQISATSVRYWINLGYGNFSTAVEMGNPPTLSIRDDFDQARVRLIDVDGSGTTDLLYILPTGGANLYYNLSGNSWSDKIFIPHLPITAMPSSVLTLDILGKGTGCLCWADTFSGKNKIKYLDLMGSIKPHLLQSYSNGLGATKSLTYAPSTKVYVEDEIRGLPWSTKLPFPVQCISKVEVKDAITGNQESTQYIYHNGCFDEVEKQFVGFEMVEEFHYEKLVIGDNEIYEPPVMYTKSWFSVGLSLKVDETRFLTKSNVSSRLQGHGSDPAERLQALKGVSLRSETYSHDGTDKANLPFMIVEQSYDVELVQPRGSNKYSVVQVNPRETLSKQYERNMQDPRTTHEISLKTNSYGDLEKSLKIVYPRTGQTALDDVNKNQKAGNMSLTQNWYTNEVKEQYNFRKPLEWKQQEYEILNFPFAGTLSVDAARAYDFDGLSTKKCTTAWKVVRTENRAFYKDSLLLDRLGEGKLEAFSILDQTYALAFTPEILDKVELGLRSCKVPGSVEDLLTTGKYAKLKNSDGWWVPSTRALYCHPKAAETKGDELKEARGSFYTPLFFVDAFENVSRVKMDESFLLVEETEDGVGNVTLFKNDYEQLQPVEITDSNLNTEQVVLDPLGQTIAVAALGKGMKDEEGVDSVKDMVLELSPADVDNILLDPTGEIADHVLGNARSRTIYCSNQYAKWKSQQDFQANLNLKDMKTSQASITTSNPMPGFVLNMARSLPFGKSNDAEILVKISYLNGLGAQFQEVQLNDPASFDKKWLVPGLSISDTKGNAVCTYQPRFSTSPAPIPAKLMGTKAAFTFFDVTGRTVASLSADCLWTKSVNTPWTTVEYSTADMILQFEPQHDLDVGQFFTRIPASRHSPSWVEKRRLGTPQEKRAAEKSTSYANAPLTTYIGSCGLPIRTVRVASGKTYTRAFAYDLKTMRMDQGESWVLQDAQGRELLSWNCRGHSFVTRYDGAQREIEKLFREGQETLKLITRTTYGEKCTDATALNLKKQVWKVEDQAGVHISVRYDIHGHCLEQTLQYAQEYKKVVDWNFNNPLEKEVYSHTYSYDNFGQVLEEKDAQGNETRRRFTPQGHVHAVDHSSSKDGIWKPYLSSVRFTVDGLPEKTTYGNGVTTDFGYDEESRHLISQRTTCKSRNTSKILEELTHVYDCAGRRTFTRDGSEQVKYFRQSRIKPEWDYTYDVMGRLTTATGRAQRSARLENGNQLKPHNAMNGSNPSRGVTDGNLLYQYMETYGYDREGNIKWMTHAAPDIEGINSWTRNYFYEEQSLLNDDPHIKGNRLSRTAIGDKHEGKYAYSGSAGRAGCMTTLPKFTELDWNMNNMLSFSSTQYVNSGTPERTYYVYDHSGNRVRKVTESAAKAGEEPRKQKETLFLTGVELQIRINGHDLWLARVQGDSPLAVVEVTSNRAKPLVRFQVGNGMELDDQAQLVSYEEYSPFGTVVYSAVYGDVEAPRMYRFAKYEHDRETGLYYCGQRYYCPWLGRWTSPDPLGDVDGPNLFAYTNNDPVNFHDPKGTSKEDDTYRTPKPIQKLPPPEPRPLTQREINQIIKKYTGDKPIPYKQGRFERGLRKMKQAMTGHQHGSRELHHTYPKEFKEEFKKIGINIDKTTVSISKGVHHFITHGSTRHRLPNTNRVWRELFFEAKGGYDEQMEGYDSLSRDMKSAMRLNLRMQARELNGRIMAHLGLHGTDENGQSSFLNYNEVANEDDRLQREIMREGQLQQNSREDENHMTVANALAFLRNFRNGLPEEERPQFNNRMNDYFGQDNR
ncbi:65kDa B protein-domain-containing protein [Mariannaea sp. PMI_226]|nr:65kDa B protein-domain-containing protein [Mariannaea sp. PMI_226]